MSDDLARERVPTRRRCDLEPLAYHPGDRGRDGSRYRPAVRTAGDGQLVRGVTAPTRYDAAGALLSAAWHDAWEERHCRAMAAGPELLAALTDILAAFDANDSHGIREEIESSRAVVAKAKGVVADG